jgi:predicted metal-dependent enzyme (double-stranded beta helix superfamily)
MTTRTQPQVSPGIRDLAHGIESVVRAGAPAIETARRVADALRDVLGDPGLLLPEQRISKSDCYCQHVLYADPAGEFSIVSLVWLPGQRTCIHDHVSWCVVGVYQGAEESNLYRLVDNGVEAPHLVRTGHMVDEAGSTSYFVPPGDIHEVANSSDGEVISIHVYGADVSVLGSSIRRRYDLPIRQVTDR